LGRRDLVVVPGDEPGESDVSIVHEIDTASSILSIISRFGLVRSKDSVSIE
jgi:hypothetical protein